MGITIHKGTAGDLDDFITLCLEVQKGMERREWFAVDPEEELRALTADGSMEFWLAEENGRLAAGFSIVRPGLRDFSLGYDIALPAEEMCRVVHMDTAAVYSAFRGRGLQRRMMEYVEGELSGSILLCTIHPDNRYSLRNAQSLGYRIEKRIERYDSIRYLLRKDV